MVMLFRSLILVSFAVSGIAYGENSGISPIGASEKAAKDLPASVTVITRSDIVALGINDIAELLALIPGVSTTKPSAAISYASYHGTNPQLPRRTKVMLDGMTLQSVGTASYNWALFPISIGEIERVEVYRNQVNPKSGSKSLQAIIKIISRNPADSNESSVSFYSDSHGKTNLSSNYSGEYSNTFFRVRAEKTTDDGYDKIVQVNDSGKKRIQYSDGLSTKKVSLRTSTEVSANSNVQILVGALSANSDLEIGDTNKFGVSDRGADQYFGTATMSLSGQSDEFQVTVSSDRYDETKAWNTCYPLIMFSDELRNMYTKNPIYAETLLAGGVPSGGTQEDNILAFNVLQKVRSLGSVALQPQCGNVNENFKEGKNAIDVENTHVFNDRITLTAGYEYQSNYFDSQTLAGGKISYTSHNLHTTTQFSLTNSLSMSVGGNYTSRSMREEKDEGTSYHFGFNYDFLESQTVKLVYTNTYRNPAPLERHLSWTYYMSNFSIPFDGKTGGFFYKTTNSVGYPVENEHYDSIEANFSGFLFNKNVEYDVKLFSETMTDLISQDLNFTSFKPANEGETRLEGVETLIKYYFGSRYKIQAGGSYIDNQSDNINEQSMWMKTIGYASLIYSDVKSQYSLTYYGSSGLFDNSLESIEANYRHEFSFARANPFVNIKLRYSPSDLVGAAGRIDASGTSRSNDRTMVSYEDKASILVGIGVNL